MDHDYIEKPVGDLIEYENNSRQHSDKQVQQIIDSINEFGFTNPILIDEHDRIIAGHGRIMAAREIGLDSVPCKVLKGLSEAQKKAYTIADNQIPLNATWDFEKLKIEAAELEAMAFDLDLLGFNEGVLEGLLNEAPAEIVEDEIPEEPAEAVTRRGDVWILGNHRLMCGDSTVLDDIEKLMAGNTADMLHSDPPYGMGKEKDGVENDNQYNEKLDQFQLSWWSVYRLFLADNAGVYIWGLPECLWRFYFKMLVDTEAIALRNQIVWDKGHIPGMASGELRQYPVASESCLFFMLGDQEYNTNQDNYYEGFEPVRLYLDGEREKMGWSQKEVAEMFGFHPRMASHWFTKSQWTLPKEDQYQELQEQADGVAFRREYSDIRAEYREIKKGYDKKKTAFYESRAYFDNEHDNMTDVWKFPRVTGEERHGHATPKPLAVMDRIIKSSCKPGGIVVEPFGGSGSTLIAADHNGRTCYTMELQEKYCDVIIYRWQQASGEQAVLEATGQTYAELKASGGCQDG